MSYLTRFELWASALSGAAYSFITGNFGDAFWILLGVMVLDLITGIMKGYKTKNLKSLIMSVGLMKKGGVIAAIILCWLLDFLMNGGQPAFVTMMIWLSIANEGISVAENLKSLGVSLPNVVNERLGEVSDEDLLEAYLSKDKMNPHKEEETKKPEQEETKEQEKTNTEQLKEEK